MATSLSASVLEARNLSQSSLIARNLYSTFQVGPTSHLSSQVEVRDVCFVVNSLDEKLEITLVNRQTKTIMYARSVPVGSALGQRHSVSFWLPMYVPGDPRDQVFDEASTLRPDAPQIHLQLQCTVGPGDAPLRTAESPRWRGDAQRRASATPRSFSDAPLTTPRGMHEQELQARDIKQKVADLTGAAQKRQGEELQFQEISRQVEDLKKMLAQTEEELREWTARRSAAEHAKQEAFERLNMCQDVLRNREVSLAEIRNVCDDAGSRLQQALTQGRLHSVGLDTSSRGFDEEMHSMAARLQQTRAEAENLSAAARRCDRRLQEVQEKDSQSQGGVGAEHLALQQQFQNAKAELEGVQQNISAQGERLVQTEQECAEARSKLTMAEVTFVEARRKSQNNSAEARAGLEEASRDLAVRAGRIAMLEGQISENRNQLKDLQQYENEISSQLQKHVAAHGDLEVTVSGLREQVSTQLFALDCTVQSGDQLESKLHKLHSDIVNCQLRVTEVEGEKKEAERARARRLEELDVIQHELESELQAMSAQSDKLQSNRERLEREAADAQSEERAREQACNATVSTMEEAEQELELAREARRKREREHEVVAQRLAAVETELEEARELLMSADEEAEQLQVDEEANSERNQRQRDLEEELRKLNAEVEVQRIEALECEHRSAEIAASLEEQQRLAPQREAEASELRGSELVASREMESNQVQLREIKSEVQQKSAALARLRGMREEQLSEIRTAIGDAAGAESKEAECQEEAKAARSRSELAVEEARKRVKEAEDKRGSVSSQVTQLRAECASLARQRAEIESACQGASNRLEGTRSQLSELEAEHLDRVQAAESDRTASLERQAELDTQGAELQEHLEALESELAAASAQSDALEVSLITKRAEHSEVQSSLSRYDKDIVEASAENAAILAQLQEMKARREEQKTSNELQNRNAELDRQIERIDELERIVMSLESRQEQFQGDWQGPLLARLAALEVEEQEAKMQEAEQTDFLEALRGDLETLQQKEEKYKAVEERLKASRLDAGEKGRGATELNARLSEVEARARESEVVRRDRLRIAQQTTMAQEDCVDEAKRLLQQRSGEVVAALEELDVVEKHVAAHYQMLECIRKDVQVAQAQLQKHREAPVMPVACVAPDDARKRELLRQQLAGRGEALQHAEGESHTLRVLLEDLAVELEELRSQGVQGGDQFAYQVDHTNLQSTTIECLEDHIRTLEDEAEVLTVGLHDAEHFGETLKRENFLMRQQLDGLYTGTINDWANEIKSLNINTAIQRAKDELSHWQHVADEAERELRVDVSAAQQQHEDAENEARTKLDALLEQRPAGDVMSQTPKKVKLQQTSGKVHSVAAALHGLVAPPRFLALQTKATRRALIVGCKYSQSHAPLYGSTNDAWNMMSFLRQSLQYREEQVRCLIESSETCPTPKARQPTRDNIMEGLQWLVGNSDPGDDLFLYFSGYGTQQPRESVALVTAPGKELTADHYEAHFVPCDFAEDLPGRHAGVLGAPGNDSAIGSRSSALGSYRLVPLLALSNTIAELPSSTKMTVALDCGHSIVPCISDDGGAPATFQKVAVEDPGFPGGVLEGPSLRARMLELPPRPTPATALSKAAKRGSPSCRCHCYAACERHQWCAELSIEGCVQGAFTWAWVKAMLACHLEATVRQHSQVLHRILGDLQQHFHCIEQEPVVQLSPSAARQDPVLAPDPPECPITPTGARTPVTPGSPCTDRGSPWS